MTLEHDNIDDDDGDRDDYVDHDDGDSDDNNTWQ